MPRPFDSSWERIARAKQHRDALVQAWNTYAEGQPYDARVEVLNDGTGRFAVQQLVAPPPSLGLHLGEMLYQFRSALDACIYDLACINTGLRPPADEATLEFPLCQTPKSFQSSMRKIRPLTQEQVRIVESMQPFNIPKDIEPAILPMNFNRALGILNDWARKDRHRKLHVVAAWPSRVDPLLRWEAPRVMVTNLVAHDVGVLTDDYTVLATFRVVAPHGETLRIEGNPNATLDIGVDEVPPPCSSTDTLTTRIRCIEYAVGSVVHSLGLTVGVDRTA